MSPPPRILSSPPSAAACSISSSFALAAGESRGRKLAARAQLCPEIFLWKSAQEKKHKQVVAQISHFFRQPILGFIPGRLDALEALLVDLAADRLFTSPKELAGIGPPASSTSAPTSRAGGWWLS